MRVVPAGHAPMIRTRRPRAVAIAAIAGMLGLNAIGGAVYALGGAENVPLEWLDGSPFGSYTIPGIYLGVVVGGSMLATAWATLRGRPYARYLTVATALNLLAWIAVQVSIIGYVSVLQPICVAAAIAMLALSRG